MTGSSLTGKRLGAYDVGPMIGAGGMGEVYRARDAKLNRDVAVKVLLPAVANDAERLARFRREAQVLASLNHPGIAQIYGIEDGSAGPFLVIELVDGPTLADRIEGGPLPVDEALTIARAIVDALEAAHERGIVHRDLKPANIKIRDDGAVKILDFGLAKAFDPASGSPDHAIANSPTITSPAMTQAGLILGTAAYMSPEQAKGRVIDKRSDIWAFGCVLYEMLTGARAFSGEDVTETIAAVVRGEPDWSALPPAVPPHVRLLLKRCLEKDRRARIGDVAVIRFVLNEDTSALAAGGAATSSANPVPARRSALAAVGGFAACAVLAVLGWSMVRPAGSDPMPVRFLFRPPAHAPLIIQGNDRDVAIAPDGSFLVYRSGTEGALRPYLMVRGLNELEPRMLPGTENARFPFVSPDGRWIGFQVGPELRKVAISGGPSSFIGRTVGTARGASWGDDDFIVFGTAEGLRRVHASGGEPATLTTLDPANPAQEVLPHVLPGSKWVVFTAYRGSEFLIPRIEAVEIATGRRKVLLPSGHDAMYVSSGHLIYGESSGMNDGGLRSGALRAVRFDPVRVETIGDPITLVESVKAGTASPALNYTVSQSGDVAWIPGNAAFAALPERTLVWVDRQGHETPIPAPPRAYAVPRISPDGTKVAVDVRDQGNDIWVWDLRRETLSPLSRDRSVDMSPLWTPDGKRVIWTSARHGGNPNLFWQAADGTGEADRISVSSDNQFPTAITPDGATIVVFGGSGDLTNAIDLFLVSLRDGGTTAQPLVSAPGYDFGGEVSPDGKWLAYHSNESGEAQVFVRPFPSVNSGRWQISTAGGSRAVWSRNGKELFYLDREGYLTSVEVNAGGTFSAGAPRRVLSTRYYQGATTLGLDLRGYDVSPDGSRFLMLKDPQGPTAGLPDVDVTVVINWATELKQRLPPEE